MKRLGRTHLYGRRMVLEWGEEREGNEVDREKAKRTLEKQGGGGGKKGKHTVFGR